MVQGHTAARSGREAGRHAPRWRSVRIHHRGAGESVPEAAARRLLHNRRLRTPHLPAGGRRFSPHARRSRRARRGVLEWRVLEKVAVGVPGLPPALWRQLLAFHAASTSASFSGGMPAIRPSIIAFCSASGRVLCQSRVAFAVSASGRNVSPAATAFALLRRRKPAVGPWGGSQMGMWRQPRTPWPARKSLGTQVKLAPAVVTALMP